MPNLMGDTVNLSHVLGSNVWLHPWPRSHFTGGAIA